MHFDSLRRPAEAFLHSSRFHLGAPSLLVLNPKVKQRNLQVGVVLDFCNLYVYIHYIYIHNFFHAQTLSILTPQTLHPDILRK